MGWDLRPLTSDLGPQISRLECAGRLRAKSFLGYEVLQRFDSYLPFPAGSERCKSVVSGNFLSSGGVPFLVRDVKGVRDRIGLWARDRDAGLMGAETEVSASELKTIQISSSPTEISKGFPVSYIWAPPAGAGVTP